MWVLKRRGRCFDVRLLMLDVFIRLLELIFKRVELRLQHLGLIGCNHLRMLKVADSLTHILHLVLQLLLHISL